MRSVCWVFLFLEWIYIFSSWARDSLWEQNKIRIELICDSLWEQNKKVMDWDLWGTALSEIAGSFHFPTPGSHLSNHKESQTKQAVGMRMGYREVRQSREGLPWMVLVPRQTPNHIQLHDDGTTQDKNVRLLIWAQLIKYWEIAIYTGWFKVWNLGWFAKVSQQHRKQWRYEQIFMHRKPT